MISIETCHNPIDVEGYELTFDNPDGVKVIQRLAVVLAPKTAQGGETVYWDSIAVHMNGTDHTLTLPFSFADGRIDVISGDGIGDGESFHVTPLVLTPQSGTNTIEATAIGHYTVRNSYDGEIVTVEGENLRVESLVVDIVAVQEGSGDPSPSNVRPISGWDEVNVAVTGKNLLDASILKDQVAWNSGEIKLAPNTQYTVSSNCDGNIVYLYVMGVGQTPNPQTTVYQGHSISVTSDANGILRYQQRVPNLSAGSVSDYWYQLELGSTATAYEPYQGTTYTTDLGRTVYGGTLDVVSGVLTVDRAMVTLDGTERWANNYATETLLNVTATLTDCVAVENSDTETRIIADKMKGVSASVALGVSTRASGNIAIVSNKRVFVTIARSIADNVSAFESWIASNPITICYELATPIEYQLTPQQVYLYSGVSNVWADSGDIVLLRTAEDFDASDDAYIYLTYSDVISYEGWMCGNRMKPTIASKALKQLMTVIDCGEDAVHAPSCPIDRECSEDDDCTLIFTATADAQDEGGYYVAPLGYTEPLNYAMLNITINGTVYENVPWNGDIADGMPMFGTTSEDFEDYPFTLAPTYPDNIAQYGLYVPEGGTYTVSVCYKEGSDCVTIFTAQGTTSEMYGMNVVPTGYFEKIEADVVNITLNGVTYYNIPKNNTLGEDPTAYSYGACELTFSNFPFIIGSLGGQYYVAMKEAGDVDISVCEPFYSECRWLYTGNVVTESYQGVYRADLNCGTALRQETLNITINGVVYENVPQNGVTIIGMNGYGATNLDFNEYPFMIVPETIDNITYYYLYVPEGGAYAVSICGDEIVE